MDNVDELCSMLNSTGMFNELEIKVMRALLILRNSKKVKCTASEIARMSLMSVTNTYKYLYSLQSKGLVESSKEKNKLFWLSNTSNPFPRLQSFLAKDYLKKKEIFTKVQQAYESFVPTDGHVWLGEKIYEKYEKDFEQRATFLMDAAREDVLISADKMPVSIVILESIKRAAARDVRVRIVVRQVDPVMAEKLRGFGIDIRLGRIGERMILVDDYHGIVREREESGIWFMNQRNHYKQQFEKLWEAAEQI